MFVVTITLYIAVIRFIVLLTMIGNEDAVTRILFILPWLDPT